MKSGEELFCSLDEPWGEFSKAWKKARHKASEKSVHNLRVNARRLIENLELARALSKQNNVSKLKRRFKKFLKEVGALRDLQVQLEIVRRMRRSPVIGDFTERLERLEQEEIDNVQKKLKRIKARRLTGSFNDIRSKVIHSQETAGSRRTHHSIRRILSIRQNEFLKAKRHFQRSEPHSEEALHEMRIALKKLRYAMEAARPVLAESEKERLDAMRAFQKLMGDSRDLEILRSELEQWAKKRGKKIAVVPALQDLEEKRAGLLKKVLESSRQIENILELKSAAPVAEKTQLVRQPTSSAAAAGGSPTAPGSSNSNPA